MQFTRFAMNAGARAVRGDQPSLSPQAAIELAREMLEAPDADARAVAAAFGVAPSALYRYLRQCYLWPAALFDLFPHPDRPLRDATAPA